MKAFITVIGHDTVGVVAKVAALCCELNINIEDVTQSVLQGMFAMIMLVDILQGAVPAMRSCTPAPMLWPRRWDADQSDPSGSF